MDVECLGLGVSVTFARATKVTEELADALSYGGQSSAMRMPQHAKNHMSSFLCEDANLVSCVAWRLKL
jgi:hypothetical protein